MTHSLLEEFLARQDKILQLQSFSEKSFNNKTFSGACGHVQTLKMQQIVVSHPAQQAPPSPSSPNHRANSSISQHVSSLMQSYPANSIEHIKYINVIQDQLLSQSSSETSELDIDIPMDFMVWSNNQAQSGINLKPEVWNQILERSTSFTPNIPRLFSQVTLDQI